MSNSLPWRCSTLVALTTIATAGAVKVSGDACCSSLIPLPSLFGAKIQDIEAVPIHNYSMYSIPMADGDPPYDTNITSLDFCNVTVTYTHPGRGDTIHVTIWLPLDGWNERLQGIGGSGFSMGRGPVGLAPVVARGYAAAQTDGGHAVGQYDSPEYWALDSPGNVNLNLLQDFASITLSDLAIVAKNVTQSFYGRPIKYSYWNGCSTGGREGLMLAQRYPEAFDGILASSPLVHWPKTATATYWAQQMMKELSYYPPLCETESIRSQAIEVCDGNDGVKDGIISLPSLCDFDARWSIGKPAALCSSNATISSQAAVIANAVWAGPHSSDGTRLWYGLNKEADFQGVANTTCSGTTAATCSGAPFDIGIQWIQYFLVKDPGFSFANLSTAEYLNLFHRSVQEYQSIMGTADADLSSFRAHGGKMITIHGMADPVVPLNSTVEYYRSVLAQDPMAHDFYRLFEAPGVGHCDTFLGPYPRETIAVLEKWVEYGEVPETLQAADPSGAVIRPLCPFPQVQKYLGGVSSRPESFGCV